MSQKSSYKAKVQRAKVLQAFQQALRDSDMLKAKAIFVASIDIPILDFMCIWAAERG